MAVMTTTDAARENARTTSGHFGAQTHTAPESSLKACGEEEQTNGSIGVRYNIVRRFRRPRQALAFPIVHVRKTSVAGARVLSDGDIEYDGATYTPLLHDGKPAFENVWSMDRLIRQYAPEEPITASTPRQADLMLADIIQPELGRYLIVGSQIFVRHS